MLYYVKPHNEYICSISVDSDFDFDSQWTLMGETATRFYMNTDNTDKAYAVAKALGVSITTVNTAWEVDPCLLECDCCYLNTLSWSVEYWDNLPLEMIDAIIATGDEYGFDLYTKAYAYMRNGIAVYNNPDINWDAPAPELPDAIEPVRDDIVPELVDDDLQLFANHYSLIVWSCITKNHNFDVLDSEDEYANKYEEIILLEYYQDDKPYRAKDFHEFFISCPEANNIINKYIDINKLWQMGHIDKYVIEIASYFFENYDIPSEKEAYHKYAPHLIPVRDDVKLLSPVEVIELPQEVISELQEDLSLSITTNEDTVMNTNTPIESSNDTEIIKFSEFYALSLYYHITRHHHNIDVWANGDAHKIYASQYSKAILYHYGYEDDEYLVDTSFEKDFNEVIKQLVYDPYDLWVIAHMTSKLVNDFRDELNEALWYSAYKAQLNENYTKYVPMPSSNSQYIIACNVEVVEPVRDDVKLLPPVEVIPEPVEVIVPQEVVSEPQEDCLSTTTLNEDTVMNTSTFIPSWEVSGYVSLLDLDFGTYVVVEPEPIVELTGQASDFACHISDGWTGQCTELTCDVLSGQSSDVLEGWYSQCCDLVEHPLSNEERKTVEHKVEQFANGKKAPSVKQYKRELRPNDEIATLARIKELVKQSQVPTITTKSGKVVPVSPHCITPHGNAPVANCITSPKVTSAIGEASAIDPVDEYKSTLFNLNDYDITRNIVVDVATTTPATPATPATPKATVAPKVSTATFASNFNSLVMAKYRELNNGIIKDSLVLNKLTSALRANNSEAYTALVTTFNSPSAVALHRQAYDAVVSAS